MPSWLSVLGFTYTRELDAAVTALGRGTLLLDVKVPVLATGGPDNADLVGDRVVPDHAYVSLLFLSSRLFVVQAIRDSSAHVATRDSGISGVWCYSRLAAPVGKSLAGHFGVVEWARLGGYRWSLVVTRRSGCSRSAQNSGSTASVRSAKIAASRRLDRLHVMADETLRVRLS
jgi:hypothetical protein